MENTNVNETQEVKEVKETQEVKIMLNITDDIKKILSIIPNKNSLYRDINLNTNYLNLKNFVSGKETLKPRSEEALINKLGYKKVTMYIKEETLSQEEKVYINILQVKFLEELNNYIQKFLSERKRFTNDEITDKDIKRLNETIDSLREYDLDLEIDGLNINID